MPDIAPDDWLIVAVRESDPLAEATVREAVASIDRQRVKARSTSTLPAVRPRRRTPLGMAAIAAGAAVAVSVIAAVLITSNGEAPIGAGSAAAELHSLADASAAQPSTPLGPGQLEYQRVIGEERTFRSDADDHAILVPGSYGHYQEETWDSADGSSWYSNDDGPVKRTEFALPGGGTSLHRPFIPVGNAQLSYAQLLDLPRDPAALEAFLRSSTAAASPNGTPAGPGLPGPPESEDDQVFDEIYLLLRESLIPSDLRAALLDVLAELPGITTTHIDSLNGEPVVAVSLASRPGSRVEIVLDASTGAYVGESGVLDGVRTIGPIVVETGVVSKPGERP